MKILVTGGSRHLGEALMRTLPSRGHDVVGLAWGATVYSVAPWKRSSADVLHEVRPDDVEKRRPSPPDRRVWPGVEQSPRKVVRAMFDEVLRCDPDKRRRWVVLVDGEPRQLRSVKPRRVGPA